MYFLLLLIELAAGIPKDRISRNDVVPFEPKLIEAADKIPSKIENHKRKAEKRTQELKAEDLRKIFKKVLSEELTSFDNSSNKTPKSEALIEKIIAKEAGSIFNSYRKNQLNIPNPSVKISVIGVLILPIFMILIGIIVCF